MYMPGRRRTGSRPSRTWICSAVYATSAPRGRGRMLRPPARSLETLTRRTTVPAVEVEEKATGEVAPNTNSTLKGASTGLLRALRGRLRRRFPAQNGAPGGGHLVEAADREADRLCMQPLRVGPGQIGDLPYGVGEGVQGGLGLGLGGLHHDRLGHDQREIDGGGVITALEQPLGHVERLDPVLVEIARGSYELVHAGPGVREVEHALQATSQVVGGQHRVLGGL